MGRRVLVQQVWGEARNSADRAALHLAAHLSMMVASTSRACCPVVARGAVRPHVARGAVACRASPFNEPAGRRAFIAAAVVVPVVAMGRSAFTGEAGINDCDPICDLGITKAGNDEYASMMAALEERKKKAAAAKDAAPEAPKESKR